MPLRLQKFLGRTLGHIMAVDDAYVFPGSLTPVLTQLFFLKQPTTFLSCFYRGEMWKYTGKKIRLNWGSNSQPQGHESDMLTRARCWDSNFYIYGWISK